MVKWTKEMIEKAFFSALTFSFTIIVLEHAETENNNILYELEF